MAFGGVCAPIPCKMVSIYSYDPCMCSIEQSQSLHVTRELGLHVGARRGHEKCMDFEPEGTSKASNHLQMEPWAPSCRLEGMTCLPV